MLHKSMQWGLVLSLVAGLSSCAMDNQQNQADNGNVMVYPQPATQIKPLPTASKVSSGSNESLQKAVPGPKRAAAPQLPVIQ